MNEINLKDKVAVITGGGGVICSTLARALAGQGVKTILLDHHTRCRRIAVNRN